MEKYRNIEAYTKQNLPIIALTLNFVGFLHVVVFHLFLYNSNNLPQVYAEPTIYDTIDVIGRQLFDVSWLFLLFMFINKEEWNNLNAIAFHVLVMIQAVNFMYIISNSTPDLYYGFVCLIFYTLFLGLFIYNINKRQC